jgi:hypothetical protein
MPEIIPFVFDEASTLCQFLVADSPEAASFTTGWLVVRPGNSAADIVFAHVGKQLDERLLQLCRVIDSEIAVLVMDDSIRRTLSVGLFNQQAIRCQLKNV